MDKRDEESDQCKDSHLQQGGNPLALQATNRHCIKGGHLGAYDCQALHVV